VLENFQKKNIFELFIDRRHCTSNPLTQDSLVNENSKKYFVFWFIVFYYHCVWDE